MEYDEDALVALSLEDEWTCPTCGSTVGCACPCDMDPIVLDSSDL